MFCKVKIEQSTFIQLEKLQIQPFIIEDSLTEN